MNIHLPVDDIWSSQNKAIRLVLGLAEDPRFSVQIYTSVSHALSEVCFSLSDLIPHKKTIAHYNKMGPDFDSVAVSLSKKELTLRHFSYDEISNPDYLVGLSKDLLMLVTSFDDPITAARHDFTFLESQLKEKRYFHIKLSNFLHASEPIKLPTHYEVLLLSLGPHRTLVIAGERAKLKPDLTPKLAVDWSQGIESVSDLALFEAGRDLNPTQSEKLKSQSDLRCQHILEFEKDLPQGITAYFTSTSERVFDRCVLSCRGVDGLSMITRLAEYIVEPYEGMLETTSLCRWQNAKMFEYLGTDLRGLILIDAKLLNSIFKTLIGKVYKDLLSEQSEIIKF